MLKIGKKYGEHVCQLIPKVFPQLLVPKAKRGRMQAQQTGCLLLIGVVLIAIVNFSGGNEVVNTGVVIA